MGSAESGGAGGYPPTAPARYLAQVDHVVRLRAHAAAIVEAHHRIVVDDNGTSATVQYSCTGSGYGRTYIRREGRDLVQLRTDGIERGAPFSIEAEGRRVGSCN